MPELSSLRPEIQGLKAYAHALDLDAVKATYGLERVVKLASNENPLGPPPLAREAVRREAAVMSRYPDPSNAALRLAVAGHLGLDPALVVAGNGSDDLIDLLVRVKARPGLDHVLTLDPCFDLYVIQSQIAGVECRRVPLQDLRFDFPALIAAADENTALVIVTSPMNPTGQAATAAELAQLARALPPGAVLVVDEAYIDFAEPRERFEALPLAAQLPNVAILRTFSKAWGLAGVRLGYGVFPRWLADGLRRTQIPFNVNRLACVAGEAALQDREHYAKTLALTLSERARVFGELERLGCRPLPSQANFILFRPPLPAERVFQGLLSRGVLLRPLASSGLPDCLRVSLGLAEDNDLFLRSLAEALGA